jgi:hypothetical protein
MLINPWLFAGRVSLLLVALLATACATAPDAIPLNRGPHSIVHELADLPLEPGARCLVREMGGQTIRGVFLRMSKDGLELRLDDREGTPTRRIDHNDVVFVARLVGKSKSTRGWIGAAVGALVSLPLSISMPGDMMIPAALAGSAVGMATGDSRADVIFERRDVLPHHVKAR